MLIYTYDSQTLPHMVYPLHPFHLAVLFGDCQRFQFLHVRRSFPRIFSETRLIIGVLLRRTCIYHLLCIGAVVKFFKSLHSGDENTLFLWLPIAIQLGIFLAAGVQQCTQMISWRRVRGLILSFLKGLLNVMGADEPELPVYVPSQHQPPSVTSLQGHHVSSI